jgi:hypothetical protein
MALDRDSPGLIVAKGSREFKSAVKRAHSLYENYSSVDTLFLLTDSLVHLDKKEHQQN